MKRFSTVLVTLFSVIGLAFTSVGATPAEAVTFKAWPVQKYGAKGVQVTTIQYLLRHHGRSVAVDGSFGNDTRSKVTAYQKSRGLAADGVVGAGTWGSMTNVTLRSGSKGDGVKALQTQLNRYGHKLAVDGSFGNGTLTAVKAFQKSKGLSVDGVVGPNTWRALVAGTSTTSPPPAPTPRAQLAKQILADGGITLYNLCGSTSANPRRVMQDTSNGGTAYVPQTGKRVYLNTQMLTFMRDFGRTNSYRVTSITDCKHMAGSSHYAGNALDIDLVDGAKINWSTSGKTAADKASAMCRKYGAKVVHNYRTEPKNHWHHVHCNW